jgi:hypothetical protein
MSDKFKNAGRRLTKEELDAIEESNKPLKPLPPLPSGGMGGKKGGMAKGQKKVGRVMSEFKAGKLKSSSGKKVTNPKQAIAIGLSEAGMSKKKMGGGMMNDNSSQYSHGGMNKKKMQDGGMVRGQGAAIRGTKFKGIF